MLEGYFSCGSQRCVTRKCPEPNTRKMTAAWCPPKDGFRHHALWPVDRREGARHPSIDVTHGEIPSEYDLQMVCFFFQHPF